MLTHLKLAKAAFVVASLVGTAPDRGAWSPPETVDVGPVTFAYRPAGDFQAAGRAVDAPWQDRSTPGFRIMKYQLSTEQYDACAAERACPYRPASQSRDSRLPAVLLSFDDARAYAAWIGAKTGETWRLPSDAEWRVAAGSRARDDALGAGDPSDRWLARYDAESAAAESDAKLRPRGGFGVNERGLYDLSGNVWEWTQDCFVRYAVGPAGVRAVTTNCGVRVVEGEHRAYVTDFIRDARAGGCSAGKPPSHLGVRLIREDRASLAARLSRFVAGGLSWL